MRRVLMIALATAAIGIAASPASAAPIVTLCSNGSGCLTNEQNVNLVSSTSTSTVQGTINGTSIDVAITGTGTNGSTLLMADHGQATVAMADNSSQTPDLINSISFALLGGATFGSAEFNLLSGSPTTGFTVTACVDVTTCNTVDVTKPQGSNWFDIIAPAGVSYTSAIITAPTGDGFQDFKQLRFDDLTAVPEPSTWAMMLLGFGGIGMAMKRSRRRKLGLMQIA